MSNRSVTVELKLKIESYVAGIEEAKRATEGLDDKVSATDRDLKKIPRSAAEAAAAMKLLGAEGKDAALKLDDGFGRNSTSLGMLDQKLAAARLEVHKLADEFNRTGNSGSLIKLFEADDTVKELEKLKSRLTSTLGDAGVDGGNAMAKNAGMAFEMPGFQEVLIAALIAGSPIIGAALNGVLLTGVGMGGLALGIVGQIHDPRVQAAFAELGHGLTDELRRDTASFAGPLEDAAGILGKDLRASLGSIDFKTLSQDVAPLAAGLGGLVRQTMPGFNEALKAAQPLLMELARLLPDIGHALTVMFDQMSKGSQGAKEGLIYLVALVIGAVEAIGFLVRVFSDLFDFAVKSADGLALVAKWLEEISGSPAFHIFEKVAGGLDQISGRTPQIEMVGKRLHDVGDALNYNSDALTTLNNQLGQTAVTMSTLEAAYAQKMFATLMNLDQGTLSWNQSLTQLHDSLVQNGRTLDEHTAKGQANVAAILSAVSANMGLYQAQVQAGMSAADAAKQYDANQQALERQLRSMGIGQQQIDGLIGKYRGIPDAAAKAGASLDDMKSAVDRLVTAIRELLHLPNSKEIHVTISAALGGAGTAGTIAGIAAGLKGKATGGPVVAGQSYIVGEHRPEVFTPAVSGYITPSVSGFRSMAAPAGGGGPQYIVLNHRTVLGTGEIYKEMVRYALDRGMAPADLWPDSRR